MTRTCEGWAYHSSTPCYLEASCDVTLACVHEHFRTAALCSQHADWAASDLAFCPVCHHATGEFSTLAVVGGAA